MSVYILYTIVHSYDYNTLKMSIQEIMYTIVHRMKEGEGDEFF